MRISRGKDPEKERLFRVKMGAQKKHLHTRFSQSREGKTHAPEGPEEKKQRERGKLRKARSGPNVLGKQLERKINLRGSDQVVIKDSGKKRERDEHAEARFSNASENLENFSGGSRVETSISYGDARGGRKKKQKDG